MLGTSRVEWVKLRFDETNRIFRNNKLLILRDGWEVEFGRRWTYQR